MCVASELGSSEPRRRRNGGSEAVLQALGDGNGKDNSTAKAGTRNGKGRRRERIFSDAFVEGQLVDFNN